MITSGSVEAATRAPSATIVAAPSIPRRPTGTPAATLFVVTTFGFAAVGVVAAYALWRRDGSVEGTDRIVRITGLPVLATVSPEVPADALDTGESGEHLIRAVTSIEQQLRRDDRSSVLVVPVGEHMADPAVASRLARTAARLGRRVALVSTNHADVDLPQRFGWPSGPGLSTALVTGAPLELQPLASAPTLVFAGFGEAGATARDALDSETMGTLVADLEAAFDLLVLASPPMTTGGDAVALAMRSGVAVLVIDDQRRTLTAVHDACRQLDATGCTVVGLVVACA
jgi:Mrp family chromosome partitioning ATPase